jgi:uroporphyrinogen decarboxylase
MLDAFEFTSPDRIPVVYHASPAGLYVHGQKLLDLFNEFPPDNPIIFETLPAPSPETIDPNGRYHEIKQDAWGTDWEFLIFGVHGHPVKYPFANWIEAGNYKFPACSCYGMNDKQIFMEQSEDYLVFSGWISIFEKLHALRPIDEVLMGLYEEDIHCMAFLDRLVDYWMKEVEGLIQSGVDVITFGDDWGTQSSTFISPPLFRKLFKPLYQKLMAPIKRAGRRIFFHSCGYLGEIFDELLDLGISGLWPQITLFEKGPGFADMCKDHRIAIYIHPDRQKLIPFGTPHDIEKAIQGYAERFHQCGGGGIFYVEIENDAPFENVEALIKSIHKFR